MEHELMDSTDPKQDSRVPVAIPSTQPSVHAEVVTARSSSHEKLAILDAVLASRDDNDSRLDTELKVLTVEEKRAFIDRYRTLPMEDRNGRGMIVFLIGRNLTSPEDFNFINGVFLEPFCRSLENCEKGPAVSDEDPHHSSGDEVTQSYPQWAALKALEKWSEHVNPLLKQNALDALRSAQGFDHPKIQGYARKLFDKLGG